MTKKEIDTIKAFVCAAAALYGDRDNPIRAGRNFEKAKAAMDALVAEQCQPEAK